MSVISRPNVLRLAGAPDLGDLIRLGAEGNPFFPQEQAFERVVVTDRIGLLVGGNASMVTLLYLWTHPIDDVSPWMAHASQWLERYPIWRQAHELAWSSESTRMVLAAPGLGDGVRSALRLVSCQVTPVRYCYLELAGKTALGWEWSPDPGATVTPGNASTPLHRASLKASEALTSEELAFFRSG